MKTQKPFKLWLIDWGDEVTKGSRYAIISCNENSYSPGPTDPFKIWASIDRYADPSNVKFRPIGTHTQDPDYSRLYIEIDEDSAYQQLCDGDPEDAKKWYTFKTYEEEFETQ